MKARVKVLFEEFFFRPSSGEVLSLLRVVVGTMMLIKGLFLFPHLEDLFGQYGYLQAHLMSAIGGENFVSRLAKVGFTGQKFSIALHAFFLVHIFAAGFFALGYQTKFANFVLWITQAAFFRLGWESVYGIDSYCHNLTFFMLWLPVGSHWSLDSRLSETKEVALSSYNTLGLRLLQIYLCLTYVDAGVSKAKGHDWWSEAIWEVLHLREFNHFSFLWMAWVPWLPKIMAWSVLFFESFYILGVWIPRLGKYWVLVIISMHIGIAVTMGLVLFGLTLALVNATLFLVPIRYGDRSAPTPSESHI